MSEHEHDEQDEHDLGLQHDVATLLSRRRILGFAPVLGGLALAACGAEGSSATGASSSASAAATSSVDGASSAAAASTAATSSSAAAASGESIPEETAGPYPADGSNGPDVLSESGIVRTDITSSFGEASGVADGVPLTIQLSLVNVSGGLVPYTGAAVYLWHADAEGRYSLYSSGVESENYLRGVQEADGEGLVEFSSIFPACYDGRWPHVHFEIYPDLASATSAAAKLRTTQLALPEDVCTDVYGDSRYPDSASNLQRVSLDSDRVFSDGYSLQLATVTGSVDEGYTATLTVPV